MQHHLEGLCGEKDQAQVEGVGDAVAEELPENVDLRDVRASTSHCLSVFKTMTCCKKIRPASEGIARFGRAGAARRRGGRRSADRL